MMLKPEDCWILLVPYAVLALFVACALFLGGCASIVSKSTYPVTIASSKGATIRVLDERRRVRHQGIGPITSTTLSAKAGYFNAAEYTIEAQHECGPKATRSHDASLDGWYIGNLLFGGLIGFLIIDPATGAMWRLDDYVSVHPQKAECPEEDD